MKKGRGRTALVAGGAGFMGSHLCDALLAQGATVICLDSYRTGRRENLRHLEKEPRFDLVEADVIDRLPRKIESGRFSHIFNLACPASPPKYQVDPEHTLITSVMGTRNLLRLAEKTGARFLLSSTSEVYGDPEVHPQAESYHGQVNCTGPRACYDEGKRAAETLTFDFERLGRAEVRVARIFNTYGPRMRVDDGRIVTNVICQAVAGEDITVYGDGLQTRSFCYVSDLVDGLLRLMDRDGPLGGPVNLGNPSEISILELVEIVIAITRSKSRIIHHPLPEDDPRRRRPDISRARKLLDWEPRVSLEEGLAATAEWLAVQRKRDSATKRASTGGEFLEVAAE